MTRLAAKLIIVFALLPCFALAADPLSVLAYSAARKPTTKQLVGGKTGPIAPLNRLPAPLVFQAGRFSYQFNPATRTAAWVAECLTPDCLVGNAQRDNSWHVDHNLPKEYQVSPAIYDGADFDKFHLAAAGNYHNQDDQDATFVITIAPPGDASLNRGVWNRIEGEVKGLVSSGYKIWVVTAPVYKYADTHHAKWLGNVMIPTDFDKAVFIERQGKPHSMRAWSCPNAPPGDKHPDDFLVPVVRVQDDTEQDLFHWLSIADQNRLESGKQN